MIIGRYRVRRHDGPLHFVHPPSGTHVGPLKIIFKGVQKLGHTHARADQPAHARADHPSTMKREDMHARADQPAHAHADHRSTMKREECMHVRIPQPNVSQHPVS